jgi:hypothetical protein
MVMDKKRKKVYHLEISVMRKRDTVLPATLGVKKIHNCNSK